MVYIKTFKDNNNPRICSVCHKNLTNKDMTYVVIGFNGLDQPEVCETCFKEIMSSGKFFGSVRPYGIRPQTFGRC